LAIDQKEVKQSGMRLLKIASALAALALVLSTTGCGTFVAERMAQAPNT
jgi:hypothetical protein